MQKKKMHESALSFLRKDGKPNSLRDSHIREVYLRYLKYCDAMDELHLPEIYFKRVVRAHYFPEQDPKNLPSSEDIIPIDALKKGLADFSERLKQGRGTESQKS